MVRASAGSGCTTVSAVAVAEASERDAPGTAPPRHRDPSHTPQQRDLFVFTSLVFLGLLAAMAVVSARGHGGTFTYALDDPYIHLTLARNLRDHGTWGITPGHYESASSSPAWTLLLALALSLPVPAVWLPLLLCAASGVWLLWGLTSMPVLDRFANPTGLRIALVLLPITLGLVPLAFTGMEHLLHAAIFVQILLLLDRLVDRSLARWGWVAYFALLALASVVRFETAFIAVGCAFAIYVHRNRYDAERAHAWIGPAVGSLGAAAMPIAVVAAVNVAAGQYPLPNSVVAKTLLGDRSLIPLHNFVTEVGLDALLFAVFVVVVATVTLVRTVPALRQAAPAVLAVLVTMLLHLSYATVGWFERYQAYLVAGGVAALLLLATHPAVTARRQVGAVLTVGLVVLGLPRLQQLGDTPRATDNIYAQQSQMADFFARFYPDDAIAVNDVGLVGWRHPAEVVDLTGLASFEVVQARRNGPFDAEFLASLTEREHVQAIAIYQEQFDGLIPPSWIESGRWCIDGELVTPLYPCVTFYAPDPAAADRLRTDLQAFRPSLPAGVTAR